MCSKLAHLQGASRVPRSDSSSGRFADKLREEPPRFRFQVKRHHSVGRGSPNDLFAGGAMICPIPVEALAARPGLEFKDC